ncbi:type VI secretion system baseplate subunit TssG [Orbaceae bacterium ac157xtp]
MEQQQDITHSPLMQELESQLPKLNFYRFCQLLEQISEGKPIIGCNESPAKDPLRFAPAPDMSFPAGEIKCIEREPYLKRPPTVRTRFLGLYGVDSVLPPGLLINIMCKIDGHQRMTDFLDMFNHRILTQFYRIWLKYHYPASFIKGGDDPISKCLLGLTGMGIQGASEQIGTPSSRFLALLGLITQRTRTAEGLAGVVRVLVEKANVEVNEFFPIWQQVDERATLGSKTTKTRLNASSVLGQRFKECNQTVQIIIEPIKQQQIDPLLPGGNLHKDLMALLRAYLGQRVDAQLVLKIKKQFLPKTRLTSGNSRLGQTASLINTQLGTNQTDFVNVDFIKVKIGRYSCFDYIAA